MQDWITDSPMDFLRSWDSARPRMAGQHGVCATCEQHPWFSFFFDGTNNNLKSDLGKKESNIARLYLSHVDGKDDPQINPIYIPGVGTTLDASDPSWVAAARDSEMLGGSLGLGGDARLNRAESEFVEKLRSNHKVRRIDVAVFGFSRGATLARAFVNRLLDKCVDKDGVPHWLCPTAVDGESAPLHFRFLGLFDTVESVGLPATNLSNMEIHVPKNVERCVHYVSAHELRACFPLSPVRHSAGSYEEKVFPGVHSDVGGGYKPNEQGRSDQLARLALNRMRIEAAISGVPFMPPSMAPANVNALFEYDAAPKASYEEYCAAVRVQGSLEDQVLAHMRLYYGWLKVRFDTDPRQIYADIDALEEDSKKELAKIQSLHSKMSNEIDTLNWRAWVTYLRNTDRDEYKRTIDTHGPSPMSAPLTDRQLAYWNAWLNPAELSENLLRFFDHYVHDSRAGFIDVDSGGYLRPRRIMDVPWDNTPASDVKAAAQAVADAALL